MSNKKTGFTKDEIEAMKKEARDTDGDFYEIYEREAEKLLGKLDIANLNQFLLDKHHSMPEFDVKDFEREMREFDQKYPTQKDKDRAIELMRKGYDV